MFMMDHSDILKSIPEFKYEDIPYNRKALFRIPSSDYLTLIFKTIPKMYDKFIKVLNSCEPVYSIKLLNHPDFKEKQFNEFFTSSTYVIGENVKSG